MTKPEIEAFLAIITYGSISAAAEKLYVTQPALSRRIHALEQELGYALFSRGKGIRAVSLTEEGEAFISVAEKWNHVYREAHAISNLKQKPVLHLASVGSISTFLLPPILKEITDEHNFYNLCFHQYHSYESYGYVESGMIDVALISDDMYHKTVLTTPAFSEPFVLVGGDAWKDISTVHPSELDPRKEIRLPWNPEFDAWHEKWFDVSIYPKVQLDQMSLLEEFLTGDSFAIAPLLVAKKLKNGQCNICTLLDPPEDEIIYYLTRSGQHSELVKHFLSLLKKEADTLTGIRCYL